MNETSKKTVFSTKKVMRILTVICMIIVFCPTFLVSCSGQKVNVSVMTAVGGLKSMGSTVVEPHPMMLICLILPIAILVCLASKKYSESKKAIISLACAAADFVVWMIFRRAVKKVAETNYCSYKATGWFTLNTISLILLVILAVLVVIKKIQLDTDLFSALRGVNVPHDAMNQVSSAFSNITGSVSASVNKITKENVMGYCSKCGNTLVYGNKFCIACGEPVPESVIAGYEAAKNKKEQEKSGKRTCSKCGALLSADSAFCASCGAKIE